MKNIKNSWFIILLAFCSVALYGFQILIFQKQDQTFFYLLQDLAFFPLQVIMIYFILEKILEEKERKEKIKKLDVVISAYFFESGTAILHSLSKFDKDMEQTKELLNINYNWTDEKFKSVIKTLKELKYSVDSRSSSLENLKTNLLEQKGHMLLMLQNPNLLEHDYFTDMLWAIFHLMDELSSRERLNDLPKKDFDHLSLDIKRAYSAMLVEWVYYSKHLKHSYPYLFSLSERKKPFDDDISVIIQD